MADRSDASAPLAGLPPHDWPSIADAIVSMVRHDPAWNALVAASVREDGRGMAAEDALIRRAAALGGRVADDGDFRAGLRVRVAEAAAAEAGWGPAAAPARNPFPLRFDAALLAGGRGTRIGGDKAFVPLGGRPLAAWAAAAAGRYAERLLVVARTKAEAAAVAAAVAPFVAAPVVAVPDREGVDGPVAALLGAADAADGLLLTVPVDVPFLPDWTAFALRRPPAMAFAGRAHPTVLLAAASAVRALAPAGSLRATLAPLDPAEVPLEEPALFNVNTREDLAAAEARLAGPRGVAEGRR